MKNYTCKQLQKRIRKNLLAPNTLWQDDVFAWLDNWLCEHSPDERVRQYPSSVTFKLFLKQVLNSDQSCQQVVTSYCQMSHVKANTSLSSNTSAYCQARKRLSENHVRDCAVALGKKLHAQMPPAWRWYGRPVKLVDGTTLSMPDSPANQAASPQPKSQAEGVGFPLMRWVGLICLGSGALLNSTFSPYIGKYHGETHLLRQLLPDLNAQDILVGDSYYCSYFIVWALKTLGVDGVFESQCSRRVDFRVGKRLGQHDHITRWYTPAKPKWMDDTLYEEHVPDELEIREIAVKKGRSRKVIVTTLDSTYRANTIAALYQQRWHIEWDLRSIKETMQMGILRCQTPEMVRKEVWMYIVGYNVIRHIIANSAYVYDQLPRCLSFKTALQ